MSLGVTEITLILIVVILLFGGKRIPELARAFGRASAEYKKAKEMIKKETEEIKETIQEEIKEATSDEVATTEYDPSDESNNQPV